MEKAVRDEQLLLTDTHIADHIRANQAKAAALALAQDTLVHDPALHDIAAMAISCDYGVMDADALLKQLRAIVILIETFKNKPRFLEMQRLLMVLLRAGIHRVNGAAMDVLTLWRDAIQVDIGGKVTILGNLDDDFLNILSMGKETREAERQLTAIDQLVNDGHGEKLQSVSVAFNIPYDDTEKILFRITTMFDARGNFSRQAFDSMVDELAGYGDHVFELMWCYFKVMKACTNRVAFLNALQHLIHRMKRPKHALRYLLTDFCRRSDQVMPSDRSAFMLANILLRSYNQELDVNIEMTPEDVLNVRKGLDPDVVHYAQFRVDSMDDRFSAKVHTIHENIIAQLTASVPFDQAVTIRQLLLLEREVFIFLSLIAGHTARFILVSALREYGHPQQGVYRYSQARAYLPIFLQHLKVIIRGVGRVGARDDVILLRQIHASEAELTQFDKSPEYQRAVVRTLAWVEKAIHGIPDATHRPVA
ncbi:hypothetical protein [Desulfosarcina ovata]|uniref:Uncharacterized protein n=1 Tax=Desulfosarcina ovata subsp. ovata TaxID=2752305 RepID=A0A5K8A9R9_9BACT|nr:hypothetical protein [Desulfosarcina ovata]BBO88924.1 hypothetical protein DSCOOX_21040 [Desulfosarcina ovata subsp. ovata]